MNAHPAIANPMRLRIDYARIVASLARVDADMGEEETTTLRELCRALGLPPGATAGVLRFAEEPNPEKVRESVEALRDTDLHLALITDLVRLAMVDGKYHIAERKQIHALGALLLVSPSEIAHIEDAVAREFRGQDEDDAIVTDLEEVEPSAGVRLQGEIAASIAAAGVPLAMLWAASPRGLSYTGVTMALDVLGFGLGPLAGVAVDVALGVLAYAGVRMLFAAFFGED